MKKGELKLYSVSWKGNIRRLEDSTEVSLLENLIEDLLNSEKVLEYQVQYGQEIDIRRDGNEVFFTIEGVFDNKGTYNGVKLKEFIEKEMEDYLIQ